jgi:DNA-directed RNA polymerase subunit RPC12/RpoP
MCRACDIEVQDSGSTAPFTFQGALISGSPIELIITAPYVECPKCGSRFLPAQSSTQDPYYGDLDDAITEALTKDLINE